MLAMTEIDVDISMLRILAKCIPPVQPAATLE